MTLPLLAVADKVKQPFEAFPFSSSSMMPVNHVLDNYYLAVTLLVTVGYQLVGFCIAFACQFDKLTGKSTRVVRIPFVLGRNGVKSWDGGEGREWSTAERGTI